MPFSGTESTFVGNSLCRRIYMRLSGVQTSNLCAKNGGKTQREHEGEYSVSLLMFREKLSGSCKLHGAIMFVFGVFSVCVNGFYIFLFCSVSLYHPFRFYGWLLRDATDEHCVYKEMRGWNSCAVLTKSIDMRLCLIHFGPKLPRKHAVWLLLTLFSLSRLVSMNIKMPFDGNTKITPIL